MSRKLAQLVSSAIVAVALASSGVGAASPIKNVIILMQENRAFDHMLGHLGLVNPAIDGLQTAQSNPMDPSDPSSPTVPVVIGGAVDGGPTDPLHDFNSITQQVFGFEKPMGDKTSPVLMNGFVANAAAKAKNFVMNAFNATQLPTLSTLATEFALFDHWHPSLPTCTNPNREYMMSGTSHGATTNTIPTAGFPQQTHFTWLAERNVSSKIYYNDDPWMAPCFAELRAPEWLARTLEMPQFYDDLKSGTLAQFSLIQPRMATSATGASNWQHPDNSVEAGEIFYAEVYEALRASSYWEQSLLLITYDEHGGFFDHQPTPTVGVPAPDDIPGDNGFDWSRLGVRVPTVAISPFISKGTVVGEPSGAQAPEATSQFEHTSIISTTNKIFGLSGSMTMRDAWAGHFENLVDGSTPLRSDCPMTLPRPAAPSAATLAREAATPLNDHHLDSINLECFLAAHAHPVCAGFSGDRTPFLAQVGADAAAAAAAAVAVDARTAGARTEAEQAWQLVGADSEWPHLFQPAARMLLQRHFGEISRALFSVVKRNAGVF